MGETRLYREVPLPDGKTASVAINRRGCKGEWTKENDEALAAIVRAVYQNPPSISRAPDTEKADQ